MRDAHRERACRVDRGQASEQKALSVRLQGVRAGVVSVRAEQEAFFHAEFPRLAGFCASTLGQPAVGADIASEAMLRVLTKWRHVDDKRAFVYKVATNLAIDELRRSTSRRKTVERLARTSASSTTAPSAETVAVADLVVRDLVTSLPARLRAPVLLHYYADLTVEDVARQLHRPPGTVRRWLAEARQLLRAGLVEEGSR
jgi:RNA polymerase sigma-70 factor, ECF subfamily